MTPKVAADEQNRKTAILVSPYFPPCSLAGVHRARHLANHLPAFGWDPIVVCVDQKQYDARPDYRLLHTLQSDLKVHKVDAAYPRAFKAIGISDIGIRGFYSIKNTVLSAIAKNPYSIVFITGFPFYTMLMARDIKRAGAPLILDFQDPWVSSWGATQPVGSKAWVSHVLAQLLEPHAVRFADALTSVSAVQSEQMARRYPSLHPTRILSFPIGGDWADYQYLPDASISHVAPFRCVRYVGTLAPTAGPIFQILFRGIQKLRLRKPDVLQSVRFEFIGTNPTTSADGASPLITIAKEEGVADIVAEQTTRIPYFDALLAMKNSDVILLIGSTESHYTASKIFPALMAQRPFLSLFHSDSSAHDILVNVGGGISLSFQTVAQLDGLSDSVASAMEALLSRKVDYTKRDMRVIEPYTARSIAGGYASLFDRLLKYSEYSNTCILPL